MQITDKCAVITGAAGGIGAAVARQLASRGVRALGLADQSDHVDQIAREVNGEAGKTIAYPFVGNTCDETFRRTVFDEMARRAGPVSICIPAAGITRDALAVRMDKEKNQLVIYPTDTFRLVIEVNLIAPIYWALEMVARIAEDRRKRGSLKWDPKAEHIQGTIIFIGSVSSLGNKGQIAYAATKRGVEGAAKTLMAEAMFYGIRCAVIHPGFTDTPMVRKLGEEYIEKYVIPFTQLKRLIKPEEIADAICFLIANSAVSGELWCDAGWHPTG